MRSPPFLRAQKEGEMRKASTVFLSYKLFLTSNFLLVG